MQKLFKTMVATLLFLGFTPLTNGLPPAYCRPPAPALNILPTPKVCEILDKTVPITANSIILHPKAMDKKVALGIEKIQEEIRKISGIGIAANDHLTKQPHDTVISIGRPLPGARDQGKETPDTAYDFGEQGYAIQYTTQGGRDLFFINAGTGIGYLYGCITLCQMISADREGGARISCMNIRDKPNYRFRMAGNLRHCHYYNPKGAKAYIDFLLSQKINLIWSGLNIETHRQLETDEKWFRGINQYAWERGIRIVYTALWDLGKAPVPPGGNRNYYAYNGMVGHRGRYYSWGNDKLLKKKTDGLQDRITRINAKGLFFHPIDTGGVKNPELWGQRDEYTRKKFQNDRAAADANVINTLYKGVKDVDPQILFSTAIYPYFPNTVQSGKIRKWLSDLSGKIPSDAYLCMREGVPETVNRWQTLFQQPVLVYHEQDFRPWETLRPFITAFRFAKGLLADGKEGMYWDARSLALGSVLGRWLDLGLAEFSWNTTAPGAAVLKDTRTYPYWEQVASRETLQIRPFAERAAYRLMGKKYTDVDLTQFNISPFLMSAPPKWVDRSFIAGQQSQSSRLLDIILKKGGRHSNEFLKLLHLYAVSCDGFSGARLLIHDAGREMKKHSYSAALDMLEQALELLESTERKFIRYAGAPRYKGLDCVKLKTPIQKEAERLIKEII